MPIVRPMFRNTLLALLLSFAVLAHGTSVAIAQDFSKIVQLEVIEGWRTTRGTHMAGLHVRLAKGWKTYWRTPGEAGIPPRFSWGASRNLGAVALHWPTPEVFSTYGMRTIGYGGDVVIPMEFTPRRDGKEIHLRAELEIGVCDDICVPVQMSLRATLPANASARPANLVAALKARPGSAKAAGVGAVTCTLSPIDDGLRLTAVIDLPRTGAREVAVIELEGQPVWVSEATSTRKGRLLTAVADIVPTGSAPFAMDRSDVRFTIIGSKRAVDIRGCSGR